MTLCIYRNNTVYSDTQVCRGDDITNSQTKTLIVYQATDGTLTLNSGDREYAIVSHAGAMEDLPRFLSWFLSYLYHESVAPNSIHIPLGEDSNQYLVVFKNKFIKMYRDYKAGCYTQFPLDTTVCIGSGCVQAEALLAYNPNMNIKKLFKTVSKVNRTVGAEFNEISFTRNR